MFRRAIIGLALEAALEDMVVKGYTMSSATTDAIWQAFDQSVAEGMRDTRREYTARVTSLPPAGHLTSPPQPPTVATSPSTSAADAATIVPPPAFPLYRYVDGQWTIVLKDVVLQLRMPAARGTDVAIHADYLEVVARGKDFEAERAVLEATRTATVDEIAGPKASKKRMPKRPRS